MQCRGVKQIKQILGFRNSIINVPSFSLKKQQGLKDKLKYEQMNMDLHRQSVEKSNNIEDEFNFDDKVS